MPAQPPAPPHDSSRLWTVQDVADYLNCSTSWVYRRAENGTLPCRRLGGLLRFDAEAIRALGTPASDAVVGPTTRTASRHRRRASAGTPDKAVKPPRRRAPLKPVETPGVRRPGRYARDLFAWDEVVTGSVKTGGENG